MRTRRVLFASVAGGEKIDVIELNERWTDEGRQMSVGVNRGVENMQKCWPLDITATSFVGIFCVFLFTMHNRCAKHYL